MLNNRQGQLISIVLILMVGMLCYSNTLEVPFQFDDRPYIENNQTIRQFPDMRPLIKKFRLVRVVGYFTFGLNYYLHGLDVTGFHIVNVSIHLINALLVFWLTHLLLSAPRIAKDGGEERKGMIALAAALIFVAHPMQTQAVTYIMQRFASLATLFYLLTVCLYLFARLRVQNRGVRIFVFVLAALAALFGMFTKQITFTLPFMIILCETLLFGRSVSKRWPLIGLAVVCVLFALVIPALYGFRAADILFRSWAPGNYASGEITSLIYFFTQLKVLPRYLSLMVFPVGQNIDHFVPLASSFFELQVIGGALFLLAFFALGIRLLKSHRAIAFGIFWFFLTVLVESSIIPIKHVIFEHRMYLPSVGIIIGFSVLLNTLVRSKRDFFYIIAIIVIVLGSLAYQRNKVWQDPVLLWKDAIEKAPFNPRPYYNLGFSYMQKGQLERAQYYYNKALLLNPEYLHALNNRANLYMDQGQYELALKDLNGAITAHPKYEFLYASRGTLFQKMDDCDKAIKDFTRAIEIDDQHLGAYINRGICYGQRGLNNLALDDLNKAIQIEPDFPESYNNRGAIYLNIKKPQKALQDFNKAIQLDPRYIDALYNRAVVYLSNDDFERALADLNRIIALEPGNIKALMNRATIHQRQNEWELALKDLNTILRRQPDFLTALKARAFIFMLKEDFKNALGDYNEIIQRSPQLVQAYIERGKLFYRLKRYTKAIDDFEVAQVLDPDNGEVFFLSALVAYELKQYEEAYQHLLKAKELGHPVDAFYLEEFRKFVNAQKKK